jgi:DHA2 family lincomycin resistance protein-like MFS transporter
VSSPSARAAVPPRAAIGMIAVAAAAAFLATFNETFLNVALTPIMGTFDVDVTTVQWLATGYLLVAAVFVPVSIVLYHRFPTRGLFVAVVALMVVGSVIGALAPSFSVLLVGRLLQAIGTGLLTPIGMNITLAVAPREKLGLAMGVMAAMTTLGPSLAIVVSGALLSIAPWTTLMWVFGALALAVLLAGALLLRTVVEPGRPAFDLLSFLLVAVGLVGLLYGISTVFSGSTLLAGLSALVGVLALAAFALRQGRIASPLLDLRPFRSTPFVLGVALTMLGLLFVFAMNVVIPLFLQSAKGQEPLGASLLLAPGILATVVLGPVAGRLFDRHGGRVMIPAGFGIMAVFALLVGLAAGHESALLLGALYVPAVLATALVIGPAQTFGLSHLDRETSGHGVTVVSTSFQIAGCLGTSLAVGVYGAMTSLGLGRGQAADQAATTGFRGAAVLVAVTSLLGVLTAVAATRASRRARAVETAADGRTQAGDTVAALMKTDVFSLGT